MTKAKDKAASKDKKQEPSLKDKIIYCDGPKLKDRLKGKLPKDQVLIALLSFIDTVLRGLFKLSTHIVLYAFLFVLALVFGVFYGLPSFLMMLVVGFFSVIFGAIFVLAAFPDARRLIMNVIWRAPLALIIDDYNRAHLLEGRVDDAGFMRVKLGKIIYRFAYQAKHICRLGGHNLFLGYINWAGGLPLVSLGWVDAYKNDKDHRQQHLDDIELIEKQFIENGQTVRKMVPKMTEEEHLKKIEINTPCYALVAASDVLGLVRESLPPEMLKYLELAYQAKGKAGQIDWMKFAMPIMFLLIVAAIAVYIMSLGGGGGINVGLPSMGVPSGVMP